MDALQYALRAYNLLLDLVGLILGAFLGPLRYAGLAVLLLGVVLLGGLLIWRRRSLR
jgi:hypothetical protein